MHGNQFTTRCTLYSEAQLQRCNPPQKYIFPTQREIQFAVCRFHSLHVSVDTQTGTCPCMQAQLNFCISVFCFMSWSFSCSVYFCIIDWNSHICSSSCCFYCWCCWFCNASFNSFNNLLMGRPVGWILVQAVLVDVFDGL